MLGDACLLWVRLVQGERGCKNGFAVLVAEWRESSAGLEVGWWVEAGLQEVLLDLEGVVEFVVWYCSCLYH